MDEKVWFDIEDALMALRHLRSVEALFADKAWEEAFFARKKWADFSKEIGLKLSDDDLDEHARSKLEEMDILRQTYLRGHLVMAYSFFEKGLVSFANFAHKTLGHGKPRAKKGNESAFFYAKEILGDKCGIVRAFGLPEWEKADHIHEIRNLVVHGACLLDSENDLNRLPKWTTSFLGVSTRQFGMDDSALKQIWLEAYFVRYTHDVFKKILTAMLSEAEDMVATLSVRTGT